LLQAHHLLCYRCDVFFVVGASFSLLHCASSSLLCAIYIFTNCSKCSVFFGVGHIFFFVACCLWLLVVNQLRLFFFIDHPPMKVSRVLIVCDYM
jgi:hypothetical protein